MELNPPEGPEIHNQQLELNADWVGFDLGDPPYSGYSPPSTPRTPNSEPDWDPNLPRTPDHQPIAFEVALLQYLRSQFAPVL